MGVFAEGTTANNKYTLPLKKGAFVGSTSILPVAINFTSSEISPAHETKYQLPMILILYFLIRKIQCHVIELPIFYPNDYLYETHKDKGTEKWEIYAWAIRDALSKVSGKPKLDIHLKEKLDFETLLGYRQTPKEKAE